MFPMNLKVNLHIKEKNNSYLSLPVVGKIFHAQFLSSYGTHTYEQHTHTHMNNTHTHAH